MSTLPLKKLELEGLPKVFQRIEEIQRMTEVRTIYGWLAPLGGLLLAVPIAMLMGQTAPPMPQKAQKPAAGTPPAPAVAAKTPRPATPTKKMTADDVVKMLKGGIGEGIVEKMVRKENRAFDLQPTDLVALKGAGASDSLIEVMLDPSAQYKPVTTTAAGNGGTQLTPSQANAAGTAGTVAGVAVNAATGGLAGVAVSAIGSALSTKKEAAVNAANGPTILETTATERASKSAVPTEVGVYVRKDGQWTELRPEIVNWKTGGTIKNLASAGVVKKDLNGNVDGPTSKNSLKAPLDVMIVAAEGVAPEEYQFLRLRVSKDYREFRSVSGGILNQRSGAMRDLVPFEAKKIAPRTFVVIVPPNVGAGEYGFLPPGAGGSSTTAAVSSQFGKIYTFHIVE